NADWSAAPGFGVNLNDQAGADVWPITSASYILVHKVADKPEKSAEVLRFFRWSLDKGQKLAAELDYVALPANVVTLIEASWTEVRDAYGKPVLRD
ncbi:MAG: phosphate ABC transporter substrate-binding protein PstS, partial [Gammaproteobacteria bacterium]